MDKSKYFYEFGKFREGNVIFLDESKRGVHGCVNRILYYSNSVVKTGDISTLCTGNNTG